MVLLQRASPHFETNRDVSQSCHSAKAQHKLEEELGFVLIRASCLALAFGETIANKNKNKTGCHDPYIWLDMSCALRAEGSRV